MDDERRKQIALHTAGATVNPSCPYSKLEVPVSMENPDRSFTEKWIVPFYRSNLVSDRNEFQLAYKAVRDSVTDSLITQLLTFFNWRSRIVGAYFAAIENATSHDDHIGKLLLR